MNCGILRRPVRPTSKWAKQLTACSSSSSFISPIPTAISFAACFDTVAMYPSSSNAFQPSAGGGGAAGADGGVSAPDP